MIKVPITMWFAARQNNSRRFPQLESRLLICRSSGPADALTNLHFLSHTHSARGSAHDSDSKRK